MGASEGARLEKFKKWKFLRRHGKEIGGLAKARILRVDFGGNARWNNTKWLFVEEECYQSMHLQLFILHFIFNFSTHG